MGQGQAIDNEGVDNEGIACRPADRCAVCDAPGDISHAGLRDRLFGAPGEWSIRRCRTPDCGIAWLDPQPLEAEIGKFYGNYYTHSDQPSGDMPAPDAGGGGRKAGVKRFLAAVMPWRRPQFLSGLYHLEDMAPGRVLEVGCGSGAGLRALAAAGWSATGIDFDERAVAAARDVPGVEARVGDLRGAAFADASFDAVVMNNVIEHLPEPKAVFAECRRILRPGGRLVMVTPNIDAIGHRIFGPDWRGLETPRHLYLYGAAPLRRLARDAAFRRARAFSPIGAGGTDFMVELSRQIAERSGRTPPPASPRRMRLLGSLLALAGVNRAEWVVLVASA